MNASASSIRHEESVNVISEDEDDVVNYIDFETNETTPKRVSEIELKVGLEFHTREEVQVLYEKWGKERGFQVCRRNSRPKVLHLVCHREGFPRKKSLRNNKTRVVEANRSTSSCKVGCRASLHCSLDSEMNMWRITKFVDEHNHEMVSPNSRKYLRKHKVLTQSAKCLSQVFESEGIAVAKVTNVLNPNPVEATFSKKDCYNYMTKIRWSILDSGDAQAVYAFSVSQQQVNHNFRYAIQIDDNDIMVNFLWIDARSRSAYQVFSDVVSFDTTYKTNKYCMPFAPFVGIDHHMGTIMFGCALLQDETEETFVWLFNAWLEAMDGKVPTSIVTDQDMAIMNAVGKVFPTSRHRLCLWHIMKKFPKKLSHIYHEHSSFRVRVNNAVHHSISISDFECTWDQLTIDFKLHGNIWWMNLYEMRAKWVPVFCKDVFFGGLITTGRSESINSFFDAFVHSGTTLKEFVGKYGKALETRYETFRRAEFDTRHKVPILTLGMDLEEHASRVYTNEIFKIFRDELIASLSYKREVLSDVGPLTRYRVSSRLDGCNGPTVEYNISTQEASCECKSFEFKGILCKHILSVLFMHSVENIPTQYVLDRWTKNIGRVLWDSPIAHDKAPSSSIRVLEIRSLMDDMCNMCEESDVVLDYVRKGVNVLCVGAKDLFDRENCEVIGNANQQQQTHSSIQQSTANIRDPNVTLTKGRKKNLAVRGGRIRSGIEIASDSKVRCSMCFTLGHNRRTCPKVRAFE